MKEGTEAGCRAAEWKKLSDGRRPGCGLLLLTAGVDEAEWCFSAITLENDTADQRAAKHPGKKMQGSPKKTRRSPGTFTHPASRRRLLTSEMHFYSPELPFEAT